MDGRRRQKVGEIHVTHVTRRSKTAPRKDKFVCPMARSSLARKSPYGNLRYCVARQQAAKPVDSWRSYTLAESADEKEAVH